MRSHEWFNPKLLVVMAFCTVVSDTQWIKTLLTVDMCLKKGNVTHLLLLM